MTNAFAVTAFVQTQAVRLATRATVPAIILSGPSLLSSTIHSTSTPTITTTALHSSSTIDPTRIVESCLCYFDSTKIVSTLVAGLSLGALFTFTRDVQETFQFSKSRVYFMRLYHVASLLSFYLSVSTVLTAQVGSTALLLYPLDGALLIPFSDPYSFLNANLRAEFLLTRWTFIMSVISFLSSTTVRLILEFGLFAKRRRGAGTMVVSTMASLICCVISVANTTSSPVPLSNFGSMTKELAMIFWERAWVSRHPMLIAAVSLFGIGLLCSTRFLFPASIAHDQLMDTERYL